MSLFPQLDYKSQPYPYQRSSRRRSNAHPFFSDSMSLRHCALAPNRSHMNPKPYHPLWTSSMPLSPTPHNSTPDRLAWLALCVTHSRAAHCFQLFQLSHGQVACLSGRITTSTLYWSLKLQFFPLYKLMSRRGDSSVVQSPPRIRLDQVHPYKIPVQSQPYCLTRPASLFIYKIDGIVTNEKSSKQASIMWWGDLV